MNYSILKNFAGKKVFITGHTGFKGSWLTSVLLKLGANIAGYSSEDNPNGKLFKDLNLQSEITHISGDIRDLARLKSSIEGFKPEFIFHLAAQPLVKRSYANPVETFTTNIVGTTNILEIVRLNEFISSAVIVTSDKCYKNNEWLWGYRENDMLGGNDPYSASKAATEVVFESYRKSFFEVEGSQGVASVRAGNVIGGGDWSVDRIVPDCIRGILNGQNIKLRSPNATRPWQHVLEPLSGYLVLSQHLQQDPKKYGGSWNFGPDTTNVMNVTEVAEKIIKIMGRGKVMYDNQSHSHEATLLQLNCDKAKQELNWRPIWDGHSTINNTASWYKKYSEGHLAKVITEEDINHYFAISS